MCIALSVKHGVICHCEDMYAYMVDGELQTSLRLLVLALSQDIAHDTTQWQQEHTEFKFTIRVKN